MKDRITIEGRNGEFGAYIARQKIVPAPAVVVLHEVFGVNADIRKTCDELAEQGVIAVAPLMVGCLVRPTEPSGRRRRGSSHAPFRLFAVGVSHDSADSRSGGAHPARISPPYCWRSPVLSWPRVSRVAPPVFDAVVRRPRDRG